MIESNYLAENKNIVKDLKKIPTLKSFNDKELKKLLEMSKIRKYKPGELICNEGYHDSYIYFLLSGKVKIQKKGKDLTLLNRCGEVFGEMGPIDGSPRSASVHAVDASVCLATDTFYIQQMDGLEKIVFGYILYQVFSEILASRLRITNEELVKAKKKFNLGFLGDLIPKKLFSVSN